jgi:hypothetical protein
VESTFLIFFAGRPGEPTEGGAKFMQSPEFALFLEGRGGIGVGAWTLESRVESSHRPR